MAILSAGDSYAIFRTPECTSDPEDSVLINGNHAVELMSKYYGTRAISSGSPGSSIEESVIRTIGALNAHQEIKLVVFHITDYQRIPVEIGTPNNTLFLDMLDHLTHPNSIADIKLDNDTWLCNGLDDHVIHSDIYKKYLTCMPPHKIKYDQIAYLSLMVATCASKNVKLMFVSEFMDDFAYPDLKTLFSGLDHVLISETKLVENSSEFDHVKHGYGKFDGNHLCVHYQQFLCEYYIEHYDSFIREALQQ